MSSLDDASILSLATEPIAGAESPCGADLREDETYISVTDHVARMGRIDAKKPTDWPLVEQEAITFLRTKSKDIEIAVGLGYALFKLHRYAGLAAAVGLLAKLVELHWDNLFPTRPKRKRARVEAFTNRFPSQGTEHGWFYETKPTADEFDAIDLVVDRAGELKAAFAARWPDDPPTFRKFIDGIAQIAARRPQPEPVQMQPESAAQLTVDSSHAAAPAPVTAAPSSAPIASSASVPFVATDVADRTGAIKAILSASTYLKDANPADPLPYGIARCVKWAKIKSAPTGDAASQLESPESSIVDALTHQHGNSMWEHLLKTADAAFRSNDPLWLDLQRYTSVAMANLGPDFEAARKTIIGLTGALVQRLGDGLFDLKFKNGTRLCSGETRMWIESELPSAADSNGSGGIHSQSNGRLLEARKKSQELAGSGQFKQAMELLQNGLMSSTQKRDRLLWRLQLARLCLDGGRQQLASPLLEECHDEVKRFHIDDWEPELAINVARSLYRCRKSVMGGEKEPSPEAQERLRESFSWLCQLDPLAALASES
jgi:type VI secretion system protein VasJ